MKRFVVPVVFLWRCGCCGCCGPVVPWSRWSFCGARHGCCGCCCCGPVVPVVLLSWPWSPWLLRSRGPVVPVVRSCGEVVVMAAAAPWSRGSRGPVVLLLLRYGLPGYSEHVIFLSPNRLMLTSFSLDFARLVIIFNRRYQMKLNDSALGNIASRLLGTVSASS